MNQTRKLTILSETSRKQLTNAKGEPYHMLHLRARSQKGEFDSVMFVPLGGAPKIGEESEYEITTSKYGDYVIRDVAKKKSTGYSRTFINMELEIWKMAMSAAIALAPRTVPDLMNYAKEVAKQLKKELK